MRVINLSSFASPFVHPRVSGAEIMSACKLTAMRLQHTPEVARSASFKKTKLAVTFNGSRAFASYSRDTETLYVQGENGATTIETIPSVSLGRINLPYVDPDLYLGRKTANQWVGYIAHELLHMIFTNDWSWRNTCVSSWFKGRLLNGLEDARIEECGRKIGFAPGAHFCIRALVQDMIDKSHGTDIYTTRNFPWILAVGLRGYGVGEKEIIDNLPPELASIYKYAAKAYTNAMKKNAGKFYDPREGTTLMVRIATGVFNRLKKLAEEQPQENDQPTPDNPQPDDKGEEAGEQEGQDGEQEGDEGGEQEGGAQGDQQDDAGDQPNDQAGEPEGGESEEGDGDPGDGQSHTGGYENPERIRGSDSTTLDVEPQPSVSESDSIFASAADYEVYVVKHH